MASEIFDVEFLDFSGLVDNECFQLLSLIDKDENHDALEDHLKEEENDYEVCSVVHSENKNDHSLNNPIIEQNLQYERNHGRMEGTYNEVEPESIQHSSYSKIPSNCVTTASDYDVSQSHPTQCNQSSANDFEAYSHGAPHGIPTGAHPYSHTHPIPSTQPNIANSGAPPPNVYSHVPQAHIIPPTVYVEHCHVNVGSPYGAHQPPPNMYVPHQPYPTPYAPFMMNDLSSAQMQHGPGAYEKEQDHRNTRGNYRNRGRGQGRGKRMNERSNSVSSEHSTYSDAGRSHYENTPPPPQHAIPNPHYPSRYPNHPGYMYASSVSMMPQTPHYVPSPYSNPNILYGHPQIPVTPQNVATFEQPCDTSSVQISEDNSRGPGYVMQTVQVTSSNHIVCGTYNESNSVIYSAKPTESVVTDSYPVESNHIEDSYEVTYANGPSDPAYFEQPEENFHVVQNSGESYSHSYASEDSDRLLNDYSRDHSPVEIATEVEEGSSFPHYNYVNSEQATSTLISAGTNVSSPCFVPNEKAHPIYVPITSTVAPNDNTSSTDIDVTFSNANYFESDLDFMSCGDIMENNLVDAEKIILPATALKPKKVENRLKAKKPPVQEHSSPQVCKQSNNNQNVNSRFVESRPKSPKIMTEQKTFTNSKKASPIEMKSNSKTESKSVNDMDLPVKTLVLSPDMPECDGIDKKNSTAQNKTVVHRNSKFIENHKTSTDTISNNDIHSIEKASGIAAWNGNKSWAQILVKPNENSNKQVAFVHPFNANELQDETLNCVDTKEDTIKPIVDVDETKIKIGGLLSTYTPDYRPILLQPRGLINKNYWCYVNAPLQALLACPSVYQLMKSLSKEAGTASGNVSTPFINSFVDLITNFSQLDSVPRMSKKDKANKKEPQIVTSSPFEPNVIYKMLINSKKNQFTEGRQQDVEEMLSFVLNGLHDEMVESLKLAGHSKGDENEEEATVENEALDEDNEWKVQGPKKKSCVTRSVHLDKSPISEVFWGTFRNVLQKAGNMTAILQPFNTLPLDIQSPNVDTLREALGQLVVKEEISGLSCSKTNKEVTACNQVVIETLPRVLILHLKRFIYNNEGGLQKVDKKLDFPIDLDITKDLLSPSSRGKYSPSQRRYKLIGVVSHEGKEATKGHYIADVHHSGYNCWIRYDDSNVKVINEAILQKHDPPRVPYLLFYRRCDTTHSNNTKSNGTAPQKETK